MYICLSGPQSPYYQDSFGGGTKLLPDIRDNTTTTTTTVALKQFRIFLASNSCGSLGASIYKLDT